MNALSSPGPAPRYENSLAFALTALCLLVAALCLPFATAAKFGESHDAYLFSGVASLWREGDWHLAFLVLGCGLLAPLGLTALLCLMLGAAQRGQPPPLLRAGYGLAARLEPWSMPEVQMLGIIVAFTKLSALVPTRPDAGLWCYGAAAFFTLLAWRSYEKATTGNPDKHLLDGAPATNPAGPARPAALGLAALFALVPAYLLPVMSIERLGQPHADTIFSGVLKLWHQGLWGLALIVFTASLLVPLLKLSGLALLLAAVRWPGLAPAAALARLHRVVHFIGRWSMLDVFLVAFLCGIVRFQGLATVEARPGALAFGAAVVLTMLATASFDPRWLRDRTPSTSS